MAHYPKVTISALPYRVYSAQLTQSSTSAPSETILINSLGYTPTWNKTSAGLYTLNATEFASENPNKILLFFTPANYVPNSYIDSGLMPRVESLWSHDTNEVILRTGYMIACGGDGCSDVFEYVLSDNYLNSSISGTYFKASFELRIYN